MVFMAPNRGDLMKRLLCLCCFVLLPCSLSLARDYYVATDGSDANPGTIDKPFATLEKARDTIRESKARVLGEGGLSVYLRQGKYLVLHGLAGRDNDNGGSVVSWCLLEERQDWQEAAVVKGTDYRIVGDVGRVSGRDDPAV